MIMMVVILWGSRMDWGIDMHGCVTGLCVQISKLWGKGHGSQGKRVDTSRYTGDRVCR